MRGVFLYFQLLVFVACHCGFQELADKLVQPAVGFFFPASVISYSLSAGCVFLLT